MLDKHTGQSFAQLPAWEPHPYHVIPILTLVVEGFPKSFFTYLLNFSSTIELNCGVFYIAGVPGHNILIDAGASRHGFELAGFHCKEERSFTETIQTHTGLAPKDIDIVLMTHLHGDHTENVQLFPKSAFYVQRQEWEAVFNPPAAFRTLYDPKPVSKLEPSLVDGNRISLFPGVHLLHTPGHTAGSQSVVVDTVEGRVIVCGICCDESNLNPPIELKDIWPEVLVPGIHINCQQAYENLLMVKREADYIITLHDALSFTRGICPSRNWPKYSAMKSLTQDGNLS